MRKTLGTTLAAGLLALAAALNSAEPSVTLTQLQDQGFVRPCAALAQDEHGPQETLRNVVVGPNAAWTLVNYGCGDSDGTASRGLWFKEFNQAAFHKVGDYTLGLEVAANPSLDQLVFVCEPGLSESNAFLLPAAAFDGPGRAQLPDLPGALMNFQDMNPAGYVNLSALCKTLIPPQYNGRTQVQACWLDDANVGLFIYARNEDGSDSWTGSATYGLKGKTFDKPDHLPFRGLDWIGNINVGESNGHIDLQ